MTDGIDVTREALADLLREGGASKIETLCREETDENFKVLKELRDDKKTPPSIRHKAAQTLLEWAWTKPAEQLRARSSAMAHAGEGGGEFVVNLLVIQPDGTASKARLESGEREVNPVSRAREMLADGNDPSE